MILKLIILSALLFSTNLVPESDFGHSIQNDLDLNEVCRQNPERIYQYNHKEYEIEYYSAGESLCKIFQIKKDQKIVYRRGGIDQHFFLNDKVDFLEGHQNYLMKISSLASQDYLAIYQWSGGAHCCYTLELYQFGDQFKKLAEIEGGNAIPYFEDIDHDGTLEIVLWDDFLSYTFGSYAETAFAKVIFKLVNGRYIVSKDLMRRPPPVQSVIDQYEEKWNKAFKRDRYYQEAPRSFVEDINNLVFTDNKKLAFDLIDKFWPNSEEKKKKFIQKYNEALRDSSRYYPFR